MEDSRFISRSERTRNHAALEPILEEILRSRTTAQWLHDFDEADIICSPVNNMHQVVENPQVQSRGMIAEVRHKSAGSLKVAGTPINLSRTPCEIKEASPDLGQHTEEILTGLLGMRPEEIKRLREEGVV